jgi:hypothetical protein
LRDRGIIAVLLGCALCRSVVAALSDMRPSGGFTLEATVAAVHANTPDLGHPHAGGRSDGQRAAGAGTGRRHQAARKRQPCSWACGRPRFEAAALAMGRVEWQVAGAASWKGSSRRAAVRPRGG